MPVLRWSPTIARRIEMLRDRIFYRLGTDEALILDARGRITRQWRRPLSIAEINQMAETPDVRARRGRP